MSEKNFGKILKKIWRNCESWKKFEFYFGHERSRIILERNFKKVLRKFLKNDELSIFSCRGLLGHAVCNSSSEICPTLLKFVYFHETYFTRSNKNLPIKKNIVSSSKVSSLNQIVFVSSYDWNIPYFGSKMSFNTNIKNSFRTPPASSASSPKKVTC